MLELTDKRGNPSPAALEAAVEWHVRGPEEELARVKARLGAVADVQVDRVVLRFGNAVGTFDIPGLGRIEVTTGKWTSADCQRMLDELTAVATGLPFDIGDAGSHRYERAEITTDDLLYHAFVYLRWALSDAPPPEERLLPALRLVLREPERQLSRTRRQVPIALAGSFDAQTLDDVCSVRSRLVRAPRTYPLAASLGGWLPETLSEPIAVHSADSPANRFVKGFLAYALDLVARLRAKVAARADAWARRTVEDCDRLARWLTPIAAADLWHEVGRMIQVPLSSTVLQGRRGYREILRHHIRLHLATRLPITPDTARDLLEAKDIATLYELWAFFVTVEGIKGILGPPVGTSTPSADDLSWTVGRGFTVEWPGVRCLYNARFSEADSGRRSYSLPLRPDITIEVLSGPAQVVHLLDAKFRVERPTWRSAGDDDGSADEERRGVYKRGDIYKMHTYRDAIGARSVWALYPGGEEEWFEGPDGVLVGAIPLTPDNKRPLEKRLQTILDPVFSSTRATTHSASGRDRRVGG